MKTGVYFTRDIGSHPHRDLEIKLFDDGEIEFYTHDCHINISKESVAEFMAWLNAAEQSVHWTGCRLEGWRYAPAKKQVESVARPVARQ